LSEYWPKILGVNPGVATIPLFGVDVPLSSESVQLGTEFSRAEMNDKIKLRKKSDHWACWRESTFEVEKYSRFLWSMMMSIGEAEPSR